MLMDLTCPVENQGTIVKTNSQTSEPYLLLKLFNLSNQTITALSFCVLVYDANGVELSRIPVTLEDLSAEPKTYFAENKAVSLVGAENAKHFVVQIESATFEDGTVYTLSEENTVEVDETSASIDDALLLRTFAKNAICFASEHDRYWRCVCGRANLPDAEQCVRCGQEKAETLEKFSSVDTLKQAIEKKEQEEAENIAQENARIAQQQAEKAQKTKKALFVTLIAVVAAAVIAVAGLFICKLVLNSMADKAFDNGDYGRAYELYQKTKSEKISKVLGYVQGNRPENLLFQSGLIAEDDANTYYLAFDNNTFTFELVCEDKVTKETRVLTTNAGGSLNVTRDWVYFIDTENSFIQRVSKGGETLETVFENAVSYLSVIGDTIYYLQKDYDNPNNLPIEQCEILASQGQMNVFMHLYKMNVEKRNPVLVSNESMNTCYIYGGRIYYLSDSDSEWSSYNLCSMDMNGKDIKTVVDAPVASFLIQDDALYYIQMYNEQMKGQEIDYDGLSYTIIKRNLSDGKEETLAQDYMATYLNISDDKLFFIAMDRAAFFSSVSGEAEESPGMALYVMDLATHEISPLVAGEVSIFNLVGDDVIMYINAQGMCRVKTDGTGFAEIRPSTFIAEALQPDEESAE